MPDAIIFVPPGPSARHWLGVCAEYCERMGYQVVTVVSDWADVARMRDAGTDGDVVVVVGLRGHLPADRTWRVEAAAELPPGDRPDCRRPNRRR